jgi:hypothetical protein
MSNDDYLTKPKKPVTFLGDSKDMEKVDLLVYRLKKKDRGVSISSCIRAWIKQGLKESSK